MSSLYCLPAFLVPSALTYAQAQGSTSTFCSSFYLQSTNFQPWLNIRITRERFLNYHCLDTTQAKPEPLGVLSYTHIFLKPLLFIQRIHPCP